MNLPAMLHYSFATARTEAQALAQKAIGSEVPQRYFFFQYAARARNHAKSYHRPMNRDKYVKNFPGT